jgi:hypothetical protein
MRKYYVLCGNLQEWVVAATPFDACLAALDRAMNWHDLGDMFYVDERGFRVNHTIERDGELFGPAQYYIKAMAVYDAKRCE